MKNDEQNRNASGASLLSAKLEGYCENVRVYLAMDELDEYFTKLCAYYMDRAIPPVIAAKNILRRALLPSND